MSVVIQLYRATVAVGQLSVGQLSVGQLSVGEKSAHLIFSIKDMIHKTTLHKQTR
jgi:hypothetical protein